MPLALLAGQLSTVAHSMAVEHQRCPEHGEMVHRGAFASAPLRLPEADRDDLATPAPVEEHGHDHCLSLAGRRELAGPPARHLVAFAPPPRTAPPPDGTAVSRARSALLALAPKTSPPPSLA